MRTRLDAIDAVRQVLHRAGYHVSERCDVRPVSFDIVARRDDDLLILKVLRNIDALGDRVANEMKLLAKFLGARALVVGDKSGSGPLEAGVLYYRYGLPILEFATFTECILHEVPPLVYAAPGGYYVRINGKRLAEIRQQHGVSLGELAQVAGVSRRTISMYESGMSATVEAAMRIEEHLGTEIVTPLMDGRADHVPQTSRQSVPEDREPAVRNATETTDGFEREVYLALAELGYDVVPTDRSPFNALSAERRTLILTSVSRDDGAVTRKAQLVSSLSEVTERPGVFFVRRRRTRTHIEGSAVISHEELLKLDDPARVLELILERKRTASSD